MKALFLFLLLATASLAQWSNCTEFGFSALSPWQGPTAVFVNTYTGKGLHEYPPGRWHTVMLPSSVPWDAKIVFLNGILLITHGTDLPEIANLTVAFRSINNETGYSYNLQICEAQLDGVRTPVFTPVPVRWRRFEMKWTMNPARPYPKGSVYGINLQVVGWAK